MAFWTSVSKTDNDPKRNFRWKIEIGGMVDGHDSTEGAVWWAKKVTKPNFNITESKHSFLNHTFYWPGRTEWQTVSLTLVDPVSPDAAALTTAIIASAGYKIPTNGDMLETVSKGKMIDALGRVIITQISNDGVTPLETWTLQNPFIKTVKFGDLDYENDDLTQIELEFRYDWATVEHSDGTSAFVGPGESVGS